MAPIGRLWPSTPHTWGRNSGGAATPASGMPISMKSKAAGAIPRGPANCTRPATVAPIASIPALMASHCAPKPPGSTPIHIAAPTAAAPTTAAPIGRAAATTLGWPPIITVARASTMPLRNTGITIEPKPAPRGSSADGGATSVTAAVRPCAAAFASWVMIGATTGEAPVAVIARGWAPRTTPPYTSRFCVAVIRSSAVA
ncbi:hypothetical protein GCM10009551_099350 [Nocardiopsis tropica]